jgi:hypothetical protein
MQELRVVPNFRASIEVFDFQLLMIFHFYLRLHLQTWTQFVQMQHMCSFCDFFSELHGVGCAKLGGGA